jgi:hypothetical protein
MRGRKEGKKGGPTAAKRYVKKKEMFCEGLDGFPDFFGGVSVTLIIIERRALGKNMGDNRKESMETQSSMDNHRGRGTELADERRSGKETTSAEEGRRFDDGASLAPI